MNNTDICNLALSYLGKGSITSIDEASENARTCKVHYDLCREMLLREYDWGFAQRTAELSEITDTEVLGWDHVYGYPDSCLAVRRVYCTDEAYEKNNFRHKFFVCIVNENTKAVCSNVEDAYMDYTYDVTDAGLFTPEFCTALAHLMASSMAQALTGSDTKTQFELQLSQMAAQKAKMATAKERDRKPHYPDKYFKGRF